MRRPAARGRASRPSSRRSGLSWSFGRTRWTRPFRAAGRRSRRSTSAAGHRRSCRPRRSARSWRGSATATASQPAPRSRSRPTPGLTSAATPARSGRPGSTRLSLGAQAMSAAGLRRLGRRHRVVDVVRAVADGARRRDRLDQPRPPVRRPGCLARRLDRDARGRPGARARPPVALRAHARRSGRRGADRPRGRPPADDRRRATLARDGADRHRTRIAPRPSTTTRSTVWRTTAGAATRSATGHGQDTRAATTSSTGNAGRTRRSVPARTPSTGRRGAGTRPGSRAISPRSHQPTAASRACRRAAPSRSMRPRPPPRRSSSDCGRIAASRSPPRMSRPSRTRSAGRWPPSCSTSRRTIASC